MCYSERTPFCIFVTFTFTMRLQSSENFSDLQFELSIPDKKHLSCRFKDTKKQ